MGKKLSSIFGVSLLVVFSLATLAVSQKTPVKETENAIEKNINLETSKDDESKEGSSKKEIDL